MEGANKYLNNELGFTPANVDVNYPYDGTFTLFNNSWVTMYWIFIQSDDPKDRDLVLHEYSHTVQGNVYGIVWLVERVWPEEWGCITGHYFGEPETLRCAYAEGWADFLGVAMKQLLLPKRYRV